MTTQEFNELLAKADTGDVEVQTSIGKAYLKGDGTEKNLPLAKDWLTNAAEQSGAEAMILLAIIYSSNNEYADYTKAFEWLKKSAELGYVCAMHNLGAWGYLNGNGTEKNIPLAIEWLTKAAEHSDADSMNTLAHIYCQDNEYKDYSKAFEYYMHSAELGNLNSMANLGCWCYLYGNGTEKNILLAIEWLTKAAEHGDYWSMNKLANVYSQDNDYKNFEKAIKWFHELIKMDNDPQSGVYQSTGYDKALCEKVIKAIDEAISSQDVPDLLKACYTQKGKTTSLFSKPLFFASTQAKEHVEAIRAIENERKEQERIEKERFEKERLEKERVEHERLEKEKQEREQHKIETDYSRGGTPFGNQIGVSGHYFIQNGVKKIGDYVFFGCRKLTSIVIPDSVLEIGAGAFEGCDRLTTVTIPNTVEIIGKDAFAACSLLTSITIPDSVLEIGERAFANCQLLTSASLPDNIRELADGLFGECHRLSSISIPNGVTKIGVRTFARCYDLKSISIPDSVIEIDDSAFYADDHLVTIVFPKSVAKIGRQAFRGCKELSSISFCEGIVEIGGNAFMDCIHLTSVSLPQGVIEIGYAAFYGCSSLTSIFIPASINRIGDKAFGQCNKLREIIVPVGTKKHILQLEGIKGTQYAKLIIEKDH